MNLKRTEMGNLFNTDYKQQTWNIFRLNHDRRKLWCSFFKGKSVLESDGFEWLTE